LWCTLKPSYYSGIRNPGRLTTSTPHHGGDPGSIALRRALFCKEESRLMSKRLLGSVLFASIVTLLLVAGALAFAGSATQASTLSGPPAASGSNLAPNAVWTDIAPFPTVTISPTPGNTTLKLKRANAACLAGN